MKIIRTISSGIDSICRFLTAAIICAVAIILFIQVIMRYFFSNPLIWVDEISRISLVYITFLGASIGVRIGNLASMDIIIAKISGRPKLILSKIVQVLNVAILGVLCWCCYIYVTDPSLANQISPMLGLPMKYIYLALPIGIGFFIFQALCVLFNVSNNRKPDDQTWGVE